MNIIIIAVLAIIEPLVIIAALVLYSRRYNKRHPVKATTRPRVIRPDMPGWVYEIIDPDTGMAVYVGQSVQVERRIDQYVKAALSTGMLYAWIAEKVQQGQRPIVRLVAPGANKNELVRLEHERITVHISAGIKLFNQQHNDPSTRLSRYVIIEKPELSDQQ